MCVRGTPTSASACAQRHVSKTEGDDNAVSSMTQERALRMRNSTSGLASVQVRDVRPGVLPCAAAAAYEKATSNEGGASQPRLSRQPRQQRRAWR